MKKRYFKTLIGALAALTLITTPAADAASLAKVSGDAYYNSTIYYNNEATPESNTIDIDSFTTDGSFDMNTLSKEQLAYITEYYDDDPQAVSELQKQYDYNRRTVSPYISTSNYTHDDQFNGYDIINGIDVSRFNGDINWKTVKASGIDFALIRVAYRGATAGELGEDAKYRENIQGALAAGLDVGVYIYSQAITPAEGRQEAKYAMKLIKDYKINLPIVMDYEYFTPTEGRLANAKLSKSAMTKICNAFCEEVEKNNYTAMVYANKSMLTNDMYAEQIARNYPVWMAQYPAWDDATHSYHSTYEGTYSYWQYTSSGSVPGISGRVDMNFRYVKKPSRVKEFKKHSSTIKSITFSWKKVPGVYGYKLTRLNPATGKFEHIATIVGASNTTYTDSNLTPKQQYTYRIRAIYKLSDGTIYGTDSEDLIAFPETNKITNVKFTNVKSSSVKISWDTRKQVTGYQIYRKKTGSDKYTLVTDIRDASASTFTDTKLDGGTSYSYKIRSYLVENKQRIYFDYSDVTKTTTLPGPVTGLKASSTASDSITLKWNTQENVDGYILYTRCSDSDNWTRLKTIRNKNTNTYTHTGLKSNKKYQYTIRAFYTKSNKTVKTKLCASYKTYTKATALKNFAGVLGSGSTITLSWTSRKSVSGYYIDMKGPGDTSWKRIADIPDAGTSSYTVTGLSYDSQYKFKLKSYKKTGSTTILSEPSYLKPYTKPSKVTGVSYTKLSTGLLLTWNTKENAQGYWIYKYDSKKNKYTKIATIKASYKGAYVISKDESDKYEYCVAAFIKSNGKNYRGKMSSPAAKSFLKGKVYVTGSKVNVRKTPGVSGAILKTVKAGSKMKLTGIAYSNKVLWYQVIITYHGKTTKGYITSQYTILK